ncbi:MAG TPA: HAD family phosphatase, partial [Aggregatilineales bacterium]|nr:HAD family phosphatase [Aggregatilineales bacterium]
MRLKAVIFDWGGVLMRTEDTAPRARWDARLGTAPGHVERVVHGIEAWQQLQRGEADVDTYWRAVGDELGLGDDDLAQLREDFYSGDRLNEALVEQIGELKVRGLLVGLLSNNTPELLPVLRQAGLDTLFDAIVVSCDIGVMKPDPRAYRAILDALGVEAEAALFVDDFAENVRGAEAAGMGAVHFRPGMD